ncbi:MAG TPA: ADOP family duplicated permease [Vicinamibacterales bacterium]|nr:ADOP family duplicated permease [Vicinamibacterales bacterium]
MLSAFSQAWGSWKTAPGVALLAVVAFAVGIGSATAIFTVINGVMLQPLPYPSSERFVALYGTRTTEPGSFFYNSVPDLQDYQRQTTSFDVFGWFRTDRFKLTLQGEEQFVRGAAVTPALARQLGPPLLGQWFADDTSAVISTSLWRRLGGRRDIIGSAITLDGRRYTVSGVMPVSFRLPLLTLGVVGAATEVWIPLDPSPPDPNPGSGIYSAYARRKPGVTIEQARADARRVAAIIATKDPERHRFYTAEVADLREFTAPVVRATLWILLGGAGLLLLIACANVATLLLARAVVRARETAIRVALGASRRQLALRYFAEGALVSVAGAAAGVGLSAIFLRQILGAASYFVPRADAIGVDWKVLGFSVAVAVATGVLAGLAPLWQATRTTPNAVLSEGVRASAGAPARRLSKAFVVVEIALAFTLMTTSAILVVHLRNMGRASLGFQPGGIVAFDLALPALPRGGTGAERAERAERRHAEEARVIDAVRQTSGVAAAAFANQLAAASCGGGGTAIYVDGRPPGALGERVCLVVATPDFFSTMRIPLRTGRLLNESDGQIRDPDNARLSVVINETAARSYLPGRNPIGASARLSQPDGARLEVVGVVGDVRNNGLNRPAVPQIYLLPLPGFLVPNPMNIVVRSDLPADQVIAAVRRSIRQADPTLVMENVRTIDDIVQGELLLDRLSSLVMTFFGLAALLMATLGIYGVMSYFVRQRTVELGTRMALGAINRDLVALVLGGGLKLSLAGVAAGSVALVGGIWLLVRYLEVANFGWLPFAGSTVVVVLVAAAAGSIPAWRTTLISPMAAMREQPPSVWRWARQRMTRAVRDVRDAVVGQDDRGSDVSTADVLTAFVAAARGADSYTGALRAVLTSVCNELRVESAALLERRDGSPADYRCLVAAGALEAAAPAVAADGFLITRLRAYPLPLPFAPNELTAVAEWAAAHRPERLDEIRTLAAAGVRLAVPLRTRNEILGVLLLGERSLDSQTPARGRPQRAGFTAHEKQVLRAAADQFALMIENARLTARVVNQETLRRDIALASDVQRRLLPDAPPISECVDFAAASVPARHIGGDYYDFVELNDGRTGIALADVSGKGVAAALIMSVVQASLRIISSEGDVPPPRLVARMSQFVYRSTPASKYATFFYAQVDGKGRRLRYVNAGHNAPYLFRAGWHSTADAASPEIEQLAAGGTVVGMFPETSYEEATVELSPGDVLLAFTDGVPEAHNPEDEEFGEERLQQLLRQTAHLPANEIAARLSNEMKGWISDAEQYDDLTFIVMKVR